MANDFPKVSLVGIRGYYSRGRNTRGIYDDAIVLISPYVSTIFKANCDPSVREPGVANLKCGVWYYKIGIHGLSKPSEKQYKALVQAAPVSVIREGGKEDSGFLGINIHRGSVNSTSSLGCQTIIPFQWELFIKSVTIVMEQYNQEVISYNLMEAL